MNLQMIVNLIQILKTKINANSIFIVPEHQNNLLWKIYGGKVF